MNKSITKSLKLNLNDFNIHTNNSEWKEFYSIHGLSNRAVSLQQSVIKNNIICFNNPPKSYDSSILSDFLRHKMLETEETFSFETVFSHSGKLDFMKTANKHNYKCYLYFAAVSSVEISIDRVQQRVSEGGHDVPLEKIKRRYDLSLDNLLPAMRLAHRVYLFDNSQEMKLVAEMTRKESLEIKVNHVPVWLKTYVLDKLK
ncbi:MAG: hypothetical protein HQ517_15760 [SAR324 cluster bacterium]|nr:hypothetical protein [SAR324 cluster bacterium]